MRPLRSLLLLVAAFALVTACSSAPSSTPSSAAPVGSPGSDALAFDAKTLAGADFSGRSLAGKPAVLWFWAPWCPVCRSEAPSIGRAAAQHPEVTFVGVASRDQVPAMNQFVDTYQLRGFTHLADLDTSVWRHFGVTVQPAFAFVAPNGSVEVVRGGLSDADLSARLTALGRA